MEDIAHLHGSLVVRRESVSYANEILNFASVDLCPGDVFEKVYVEPFGAMLLRALEDKSLPQSVSGSHTQGRIRE